MWELRWVLLGLGVLVVGGVYLWGRKPLSFTFPARRRPEERAEPSLSELEIAGPAAPGGATKAEPELESTPRVGAGRQRVVTVRLIPGAAEDLSSEAAVLALREAGLMHGKYGIFHYPADQEGETLFSVASLIEPGSFDLTNLKDSKIPGMSFFMVLPGVGDPVVRFDKMVETARELAQRLDSELLDERGSSWSIQRERYVREEVIEYRHQLTRR